MTLLTSWPVDDPGTVLVSTDDPMAIARHLAEVGVRFEQWALVPGLAATATQDEVLDAYRSSVEQLVVENDFTVIDVVQLHPSQDEGWAAAAAAARQKFLSEHTHDDDEVRFFVHGSGVFYLHIADQVHAVLCEAGDLLGVPAMTTHWFDMGTRPDFTAIRFFVTADGWVGNFTGDPIATRFTDFDALAAGRR